MRLTGAQVFHPRKGFVLGEVCAGNGVLTEQSGDKAVDLAGCYVIPGLIDLHFHGCVGEDFSDATPDGLQKIADYQLSRGITGICPAGMTLGEDTLTAICETPPPTFEGNKPGAELLGLHLEGPFISMAKKGAQNGDFVHDPDGDMLERLQKAAKGHVKLVTLAPEGPGAIDFIRKANELGVRVSLGHTTADYDTATAAYNAGARQATHLFNAMPSFTHREPGVIGAAADHEEVMAELICDGVHVHASAVRAMFRLFGPKRMILISDSLRAAGMGDGEYPFGGQYIEVHGARATILGHPETLAGSVSDLMGCVKKATEFGVSLWAAVTAASVNPAKALGVYDRLGSLDAGKDANFAVLNTDYTLKAVVFHGQVVSGAL